MTNRNVDDFIDAVLEQAQPKQLARIEQFSPIAVSPASQAVRLVSLGNGIAWNTEFWTGLQCRGCLRHPLQVRLVGGGEEPACPTFFAVRTVVFQRPKSMF